MPTNLSKKEIALRLVLAGTPSGEAAKQAGVSVKTLFNMPEYKLIRAKKKLEQMPRKIIDAPNLLTRIGEVGKNKHNKMVGIYQCQCGTVKEIMDDNVGADKTTISCGCYKKTNACKDARSAGIKASWASGTRKALDEESKERVAASNRVLALAKIGVARPPGRAAASPDNWASLYWQLVSPDKFVMEGLNLNHLIRTHAHLFDPNDLNWKNSQCRASKALRNLLANPKKQRVNNSWKGWIIGDKMKRDEAPK